MFLSGHTRAGEPGWARQFGTRAVDDGFGIARHSRGNAYVTGPPTALPGQTSADKGDVFVRRYDPFGGALYVAGETFASLPGQVSSGQRDAFLIKLVLLEQVGRRR